jgi:uncharacterized membrane protein YraQ (UPF0718 family)
MSALGHIASLTWEGLVELLPWFFLAILIGASVDILYLDIPARRSFKRHGLLGILFTTGLGAFSPFCSFTVIPLIRRLLRSGVPLSAVMAFWIASPAMDPPIYGLTAAEIGVPLATARLLGAVVLSAGAGLFVLFLERRGMLRDVLRDVETDDRGAVPRRRRILRTLPSAIGRTAAAISAHAVASLRSSLRPAPAVATAPVVASVVAATAAAETPPLQASLPAPHTVEPAGPTATTCDPACASNGEIEDRPWWPAAKASLRTRRNWIITGRNIVRDSMSLGKWLVFACVFQALIRLYVPTDVVTSVLGHDIGLLAIPLAVFISVPLYLNAVGAIPIVGALLGKGMAQGAAVSFLLGGAVTTIPAMVAVRSVVNNRVFAIYLGIGLVGSTLVGFAAELLL